MNKFWSTTLQQTEPYVPGEQPKGTVTAKLNTNENPYPPSPAVLKALHEAVNEDLRLYPDPDGEALRVKIAHYYAIDPENVFIGNGSDEILAFCFPAFFNHNQSIFFPDITYSFYPVYAKLFGIPYQEIPLNDDFTVPVGLFAKKNGGIIIPNPNAPTGRYLETEALIPMIENNHTLGKVVIIDEAYIDFGGISMLPFINKFPNLLIVQTLSKSRSLAGLRIGLAIANKGLIDGLVRIKSSVNSYTLDRLALAGAIAAFEDDISFRLNREKIIATRNRIVPELECRGFYVIPSRANFVFVKHGKIDATTLQMHLRSKGIYVRHFNKPKIDNYLRITIGTDQEMDLLLEAIMGITGT